MKTWALIKDGNVRPEATKKAETKPTISASKGTYYEQVLAEPPEILPTQKRIESWEVVGEQYVQSWQVVDKTPLELWHYPEFAKRIKIAVASLANEQAKEFASILILWWSAKENVLKRTSDDEFLYFYCGQVLPEHQSIVEYFQGVFFDENRPNE
jgi:hypothetical protein